MERESFQGQNGIVGLNDNVTDFLIVWKDTVGLDDLFRVAIIQLFQEKGTDTGTCTTSNGM